MRFRYEHGGQPGCEVIVRQCALRQARAPHWYIAVGQCNQRQRKRIACRGFPEALRSLLKRCGRAKVTKLFMLPGRNSWNECRVIC